MQSKQTANDWCFFACRSDCLTMKMFSLWQPVPIIVITFSSDPHFFYRVLSLFVATVVLIPLFQTRLLFLVPVPTAPKTAASLGCPTWESRRITGDVHLWNDAKLKVKGFWAWKELVTSLPTPALVETNKKYKLDFSKVGKLKKITKKNELPWTTNWSGWVIDFNFGWLPLYPSILAVPASLQEALHAR